MKSKGFTLIEIMVVIIILGLLAAIVMPRIVGETDRAERSTCPAAPLPYGGWRSRWSSYR